MNQDRALPSQHDASAAIRCFATSAFRAIALAFTILGTSAGAAAGQDAEKSKGTQFRVSFGAEVSKTPLDGRLLVMLSTDPKDEPRFQINDSPKTQQIFGIDVDGLRPGQEV